MKKSSGLSSLLFSILMITFTNKAQSVAAEDLFSKFPNPFFIESGSHRGNGIKLAIEAGFPQIYSIELAPLFYRLCIDRFEPDPSIHFVYGNSSEVLGQPLSPSSSAPRVHLIYGDSTEVLGQILNQIDEPVTFWLDGHYSASETAMGDTNTPILAELETIARHPIKTHTILIDDMRTFGTIYFDFIELQEIIDAVLRINPFYEISFEDGTAPNDILVAQVKRSP